MLTSVAIIVPCYNQAHYLAETLDSVLAQTYFDWQCVIVNDGSSDNTEQVATEYCMKDTRFTYVYKENGGLSSARNAGIQASYSKYILPLDSDDLIGRTYLALAVDILNKHPEVSIVYSRVKLFGKRNGEWNLPDFSLSRMMGRNIVVCSGFYRRVAYDRTLGYNQNMKYGYEDWDFWLSILEQGGTVYRIDELLFFYRIRNRSMLRSLTREQLDFLRYRIWENHRKLYAEYFYSPIESFEYHGIARSMEYRVGKILLAPIRWLLNKHIV